MSWQLLAAMTPAVGLQDVGLAAPLVDLLAGYDDFVGCADGGGGWEGDEEEGKEGWEEGVEGGMHFGCVGWLGWP